MAAPYRIVIWQLLATVVVASVLFVWELFRETQSTTWWGFHHTVSALAAGMVCVVPAALYAWRAAVERSASRFLLQGVLKFVLTLAGLSLGIVLIRPAAGSFFGTFVLLQVMYVVVPLTASGGTAQAGKAVDTRGS